MLHNVLANYTALRGQTWAGQSWGALQFVAHQGVTIFTRVFGYTTGPVTPTK